MNKRNSGARSRSFNNVFPSSLFFALGFNNNAISKYITCVPCMSVSVSMYAFECACVGRVRAWIAPLFSASFPLPPVRAYERKRASERERLTISRQNTPPPPFSSPLRTFTSPTVRDWEIVTAIAHCIMCETARKCKNELVRQCCIFDR